MEYDAVIFDNDGVLTELTPRETLTTAIRATYGGFGVPEPDEEDVEELLGVTVADVERICERYAIGDVAGFWERRDRNASLAQQADVREGVKGLYDDFDAVYDLDADRAIVSNNQQATVDYILECFDLRDTFVSAYGRQPTLEDVGRKKPAPYYVERALADLGTDDALMVGDSDADVLAANAAGIDSAFIRRPHRNGYELPEEPTYEIESLDELPGIVSY